MEGSGLVRGDEKCRRERPRKSLIPTHVGERVEVGRSDFPLWVCGVKGKRDPGQCLPANSWCVLALWFAFQVHLIPFPYFLAMEVDLSAPHPRGPCSAGFQLD